MHRIPSRLALVLLGVTLLALASSRAFAAPAAEPLIAARFRLITWQSGQPERLAYYHKGQPILVESLSSSLRSPLLDYHGPATLEFFPPTPSASAASATSPAPRPAPLARVPIPPGMKYPLVVLAPNPGGDIPFTSLVIDDDPATFPFGSYLFVNFSRQRVATELGKVRFVLEPGQRQLAPPTAQTEKTLQLRMAVSQDTAKGWKLINDDFYPNWPERRTVVFLVDRRVGERVKIDIRTLLENRAVWDAATKASASPAPPLVTQR